jgi:hypothetical protein
LIFEEEMKLHKVEKTFKERKAEGKWSERNSENSKEVL